RQGANYSATLFSGHCPTPLPESPNPACEPFSPLATIVHAIPPHRPNPAPSPLRLRDPAPARCAESFLRPPLGQSTNEEPHRRVAQSLAARRNAAVAVRPLTMRRSDRADRTRTAGAATPAAYSPH